MALIIGLTPVICKAVMAFKEPLIRTNLNVRLRLRTFFFLIFAHLISPWNVIAKKVCCLEIFRREKRFFKFCRLDRGFPHEWNCTAEPKTHTRCTSINFSPWEKKIQLWHLRCHLSLSFPGFPSGTSHHLEMFHACQAAASRGPESFRHKHRLWELTLACGWQPEWKCAFWKKG